MYRTFLVPLSALALGATAHAEEPDPEVEPTDVSTDESPRAAVIGQWTVATLDDAANDTYSLPYVTTETFRRTYYTETWSMALTVGSTSVALTSTYVYSSRREEVNDHSIGQLTYSGAWSQASETVFALAFRNESLNMSCTVAGDEMECLGTAESPDYQRIAFVRDATEE